jgi:dTDP-4-dehydrorhamnose reductase
MKILLIGANGQLAQDILAESSRSGDDVIPVTHEQLDVRDAAGVEAMARQHHPKCIINTAAFHRVDACEDQPELTFAVNRDGACNLARAAEGLGALLVQFSTDYVFDGSKKTPYTERDPPRPLSVYGKSRLAGEVVVAQNCRRFLIIRTCGLYGHAGSRSKSGNFVETMLRLATEKRPARVVDDQVCTPTSTEELAQRLQPLLRGGAQGLFHMTNNGECSWYEFAREIFRLARVDAGITPVSSAEYAARAPRPLYSVLDNAALRAAGEPEFDDWRVALARYVAARHPT